MLIGSLVKFRIEHKCIFTAWVNSIFWYWSSYLHICQEYTNIGLEIIRWCQLFKRHYCYWYTVNLFSFRKNVKTFKLWLLKLVRLFWSWLGWVGSGLFKSRRRFFIKNVQLRLKAKIVFASGGFDFATLPVPETVFFLLKKLLYLNRFVYDSITEHFIHFLKIC